MVGSRLLPQMWQAAYGRRRGCAVSAAASIPCQAVEPRHHRAVCPAFSGLCVHRPEVCSRLPVEKLSLQWQQPCDSLGMSSIWVGHNDQRGLQYGWEPSLLHAESHHMGLALSFWSAEKSKCRAFVTPTRPDLRAVKGSILGFCCSLWREQPNDESSEAWAVACSIQAAAQRCKLPKLSVTCSGRMPTSTAVGCEELSWLEKPPSRSQQHLPSGCPGELESCEGAAAASEAARLYHLQLPSWPPLASRPQLQFGGEQWSDREAAAGFHPPRRSLPGNPP